MERCRTSGRKNTQHELARRSGSVSFSSAVAGGGGAAEEKDTEPRQAWLPGEGYSISSASRIFPQRSGYLPTLSP
jgi:hypothetical protein